MFLSEIAPTKGRGAFGALNRITASLAILLSQVMGVRALLGTAELWPYLLLCSAVPAVVMLIILPFIPSTPTFLYIRKHERQKTLESLTFYRPNSVMEELKRLEAYNKKLNVFMPRFHFMHLFKEPTLRKPLGLAILLMFAHQMTGFKIIIYFSKRIMETAGIAGNRAMSEQLTLCIGGMNLVSTMMTVFVVDKMGRKLTLIVSVSGMYLSFSLLYFALSFPDFTSSYPFVSITLILCFVMFYAIGPGPIPWFMVSELFQADAKPAAVSLVVAFNFLLGFAIAWLYPVLKSMGKDVFLLFCSFQIIILIFIIVFLIETKGKPIEEILLYFEK